MFIEKQPFIAHLDTIDEDYRVIYYSDINPRNLYAHMHDFFEMFILVRGNIVYRTGGIDFFMRAGDILFINKNQLHCPRVTDPSQPYERIALHVSHEFLQELSFDKIDLAECFTLRNFMVYHYPQAVQNNIHQLIGKLSDLSHEKPFGHRLLGRAYLTELFVEINQYNHNKSIFSFDKEKKDVQLAELIKQYTLENITRDIKIKELADHLYMSEYHLMHLFKRHYGISVYQLVVHTRLQAAKELIQQGKSFSAASQNCGFGPYSNFYRAFVREHGVSPREYFGNA